MTRRIQVQLTAKQRTELELARDRHEKPYIRERATAILKVAAGPAVRQVAAHGLLKARDPETVAAWVRRYQADGLVGLGIRAGRGRKPAFSPQARQRRSGAHRTRSRGA